MRRGKGLTSTAGQKVAQDAKKKAWAELKRLYPIADLIKAGPDSLLQSVSGSDPKCWSQAMKEWKTLWVS